MKKIIAALSAAALIAVSAVSVSAQETKKFDDVEMKQFGCVESYKDGTLSISISAELPNVSSVHLRLDYDKTKLKYVSSETKIGHGDCKDYDGSLEWSTLLDPQGQKLSYFDYIAHFNFEVIGNIDDEEKCMSVGVVEAYDSNMNDIDFLPSACFELGSSGSLGIIGDVNIDNSIDSNDALAVLRQSASSEDPDTLFRYFADVNHDLVIDSTDALIILRHSVGMKTSEANVGSPCLSMHSRTLYLDTI